MSYLAQSQLETDPDFQRRVYSVNVQQASVYKDDARPAFVATANAILTDEPGPAAALLRLAAAAPEVAERVDNGDGTIDQSKVTDDDLLAITQGNWETVSNLYFDQEGIPQQ